jgi:hypothetical protein
MKMTLNTFIIDVIILSTALLFEVSAISPNPIISQDKPVFGSPSANLTNLVNGKFGESSWNVANGSWVAINIGSEFSKIFISWNNPNYSWSDQIASTTCPQNMQFPVDYQILRSANSTNGVDGDWISEVTVQENTVTARGHLIDFTGSGWVKINITKGGGALDEIEVFNASNGFDDSWFFPGTSISANAFKASVPVESFADLVRKTHPSFTPAIVRGAIPCIKSGDVVRDISKYLDMARNVKYWAIEMGTNDAWGGTNGNVTTFITNMKLIIDSCKANGIEPIIARMIGTNSAKANWQIHPDFLQAIDDLTSQNKLIPGPDFYTWFSTHPADLNDDGVHPSTSGGAAIHRLWAEKIDSLYKTSTAILPTITSISHVTERNLFKTTVNGTPAVRVNCAGTLSVFSLKGILVEKVMLPANETYRFTKNNGLSIVHFSSQMGEDVLRVNHF